MNLLLLYIIIVLSKFLFIFQAKNSGWEGGMRNIAAIWSPLIKNPKRVSNNLMHISDWLPTLFSAAGNISLLFFYKNDFKNRQSCIIVFIMYRVITNFRSINKMTFLLFFQICFTENNSIFSSFLIQFFNLRVYKQLKPFFFLWYIV